MSQIKDDKSAKVGLSGLFGGRPNTEVRTGGTDLSLERKELTKEELVETLSPETKEVLQKEIQRRQYLKAGRPPKGADAQTGGYTRMTFLISPEKQTRLREIALKEGLFIKEILDRGIDLVIAEYERKEESL